MKLTRRVLSNISKPVDFSWPWRNLALANNMLEFMHSNQAIGLAAPQIGVAKRLFVMAVQGQQLTCFNPEIVLRAEMLSDFAEACLSFPGDQCTITRPAVISVRYQDHSGHWTEHSMAGLAARCFQHELDHLDGVVMHDRKKEQDAAKS